MESDKRQEFRTYKKLDLNREQKSKVRRAAVSEKGIFRYIGGNSSDRPYLKVLKSEYEKIWREVETLRKNNHSPSNLKKAADSDLSRNALENLVYDRLLTHGHELQSLGKSFEKKHGRKMTAHEMELFSGVLKKEEPQLKTPKDRADLLRKFIVGDVVEKIKQNQKHDPSRLQHTWADIVGPDAAMDTLLEQVDPEKGIAICRCLSSSQKHQLIRRRDLAQKLGKALGMNIKRIRFR